MIQFLHPWRLLGLGAAAIPLLLHLRRRREPPTVAFPAVRYLRDATREHEQRLRLRHWLLLLLRMLLIAALALAAAGPSLPVGGVDTHTPAALAIVVDNSLSSGAIAGGSARIEALRHAARSILARAAPTDALWLLTADGIPRAGDPAALGAILDTLAPVARRLDLGAAIAAADAVVRASPLAGGLVVVTDLQASAVTAAAPRVPVVVVPVSTPPVSNLGLAPLDLGPEPWGAAPGRIGVGVVGDRAGMVPVRVQVGARPAREALVGPGRPASVLVPGLRPGWYEVRAELDPDELRADDQRWAGLRVASPAAASETGAGRYVAAALETLRESGRIASGDEVSFGALGRRSSIVLPPDEPSRVGAVDRALAERGATWRFGGLVSGASAVDSGAWLGVHAVARRYRLVPTGSGRTGVLATVAGEPWIVRSGDVILVGSRLEPEWTDLPLRADFVPFLDALVNRIARGEVASLDGAVGTPTLLPDRVTEVRKGDARWRVEGGAGFTPREPGVYWLVAGRDTIGALGVGADPRESDLRAADRSEVERLWGARVAEPSSAARAAFALAARSDLRGPLLWLALVAGLAELLVASGGRRRRA